MGKRRQIVAAFTLPELLVLVGVCAILLLVLVASMARHRPMGQRIKCVNNLKNVGLAFRIFATDNHDLYPFQIEGTNGTKNLLGKNDAFRHFLAISNELSTPKIVHCPNDLGKIEATSWGAFSNTNLSYFVGAAALQAEPQWILSGDRNWLVNGVGAGPGLLAIPPGATIAFSKGIHQGQGNICLGDGSVQEMPSVRLTQALKASGGETNRLLFP
jgi:prepilin-type processing-associated H-X9-DG protein